MRRCQLILGFILLLSISVFAQAPKLEEVYDRLDTTQSAIQYCKLALHEGSELRKYNQLEDSKEILRKALWIAQKDSLIRYEIAALFEISNVLDMEGDTDEAVETLTKAVRKTKKEGYFRAGQVYKTMARFLKKQDQLDSALHYLSVAESWYLKRPPEQQYYLWSVYDHWHSTYLKFGDLNRAEEYLNKAFSIVQEGDQKIDRAYVLNRLQELALKKGDAEQYARYHKAYYDNMSDNRKQSLSHGITPPDELSATEQIEFFNQLLSENNKLNFIRPNFRIQQKLARLYLGQDQYASSLKVLQTINTSLGDKVDSVTIFKMFQEAYLGLGQPYKALTALQTVDQLKDQLNEEKETQQLLELEKKYQTAQKEQELALAKVQQEAQEVELLSTRKQRNAYIMTALFLILLLGLIGYMAIQNRKKNQLLQEQNKQIGEALKDKEILLREIHHRVKNNLQVVSSLLNLQSQYISDEEALKAIVEGKNRVSSMALIHQSLYREDGLTSIDTQEYFSNLIENLLDSYQVDDEHIDLEMNVHHIELDVETMIPLGLIANELISNVLKHAFRRKSDQNHLYFGLSEESGQLKLEIRDNGVGMNPEAFFDSPNFGNKLIQAFQKKLQADIKIENEGGSRITLQIAQYKKAA